jgi:hypothetical protein
VSRWQPSMPWTKVPTDAPARTQTRTQRYEPTERTHVRR